MPVFLISSMLVLVAATAAFLFWVALWSRREKASVERLRLIGRQASVVKALNPEGAVMVGGELWRARASGDERVECGEHNVRIVGARGHLLEVEPA